MTDPVLALEAAGRLTAAEAAVELARQTVEDLHGAIRAGIRILDDAEFDSAKAALTDRTDFYLESAGEHLNRLHTRCDALSELSEDLTTCLDRAQHALGEASGLLSGIPGADPDLGAVVTEMRVRVAGLSEALELARPTADLVDGHVRAVHRASAELSAEALLRPQPLRASIRSAGQELGRADEGVRILDNVMHRAAEHAHASVDLAHHVASDAERLQSSQRRERAGAGAAGPPNLSGPAR
ncbi:MAG: hypothetical protein L0H74_05970 [Brachybacterium sp.]|nr:hypothetical protein [Brachybacterium sp.]